MSTILTSSLFKSNVIIISNIYNQQQQQQPQQQLYNKDESITTAALNSSIIAALSINNIIRSSLGPRSMSKLIINEKGQSIITNDGASILKNIKVNHPAASILVDIALSQDRDVGDGTTSVVLLCCEILKSVQALTTSIHQTTLSTMLYESLQYCLQVLEKIAIKYDNTCDNDDILLKIAGVSLGTKHYSYWNSNMISIALQSIRNSHDRSTNTIDVNNKIKVLKLISSGGSTTSSYENQQKEEEQQIFNYSIDQSEYLKGIVIQTSSVPIILKQHQQQTMVDNNNISNKKTLSCCIIALESQASSSLFRNTRSTLSNNEQLEQYLNRKDINIMRLYEKLISLNVDIIFFKYNVSDYLVQMLVQKNISVIQNINDENDLNKLCTLTNSMIITSEEEIDKSILLFGKIDRLSLLTKIDSFYFIHISETDTNYSTILLRGPSIDIVNDLEIGMNDALYLLKSAIESSPLIVYGGGSCEMAISIHLKNAAQQLDLMSPKRQLYLCLAECFTVIPLTLASNCNLINPLNTIAKLEYLHTNLLQNQQQQQNNSNNNEDEQENDKHFSWGLDGWSGEISDMRELGIIEPLVLKKSIINTAFESCMTLLRIDTIVNFNK